MGVALFVCAGGAWALWGVFLFLRLFFFFGPFFSLFFFSFFPFSFTFYHFVIVDGHPKK